MCHRAKAHYALRLDTWESWKGSWTLYKQFDGACWCVFAALSEDKGCNKEMLAVGSFKFPVNLCVLASHLGGARKTKVDIILRERT